MIAPVRLALVVAAALLVTVAGAPSTPRPVTAAEITVSMQELAYSPAQLTVAAGDTIVWVNDDGYPHDVVSGLPGREDEGQRFQSPMLDEGERFSHTFTEPGTYDYFCSLHPFMLAQVTVGGSAETPSTDAEDSVLEAAGG